MRTIFHTALPGVILAAALVSAPAAAVSYTFATTASANAELATGASQKYTQTVDGKAISATVSAWNMTATGGSLATAQLGTYQQGLGVISGANDNLYNTGAGNYNQHQIDNVGSTFGSKSIDFVQIVFDTAVTLSGIGQYSYAVPTASGNSYAWIIDNDFAYGHGSSALGALTSTAVKDANGNVTYAATTASVNQVASSYASMLADYSGTGSCSGYTTANTSSRSACADTRTGLNTGSQNAASNVWWISASILNPDNKPDAFKLSSFTVNYVPLNATGAVPEPASWAMMIAGFGLVGAALRRKQAHERLAAIA